MNITWHERSPIYRQLADRLRELILEGIYDDGDSLPSVRQIATEHQINPITVSKAFQLLVDESLVEKRRGLGMYVAEGATESLLGIERQEFLQRDVPAFKERAQRLGFSLKELLEEAV